ncbi:universal stress protein [Steroidobacter denitrificans]|nr:universal stress protein [Steroidobacter denitrificans]
MRQINKILVIVDPTADTHPGVEKAGALAQKLDARLELFICDSKAVRQARLAARARVRTPPDPARSSAADPAALLESLAEPLRAGGIAVTTETECVDLLLLGLIDRTRRTTADLVVKDTHHHSLLRRTLLTNTDWQLIRSCPAPLLLTKPAPWRAPPQIVAAIDPGHVNDKPEALDHDILGYAAAVAAGLHGDLHALHAYLPMAVMAAAAAVPPLVAAVSDQDLKAEEEARRKEIAALVAGYGIDLKRIRLEVGGPVEVLPRAAASLHADIMVLGAISRSGLQRAFIGSTAEDVLEQLPCDALIVKPPNFADLLPF